jgi:hypothetical protein
MWARTRTAFVRRLIKLAGGRKRVGGANQRSAATRLLRQCARDAMAVDSLDSCGAYFGTTGGQVYFMVWLSDSWRGELTTHC